MSPVTPLYDAIHSFQGDSILNSELPLKNTTSSVSSLNRRHIGSSQFSPAIGFALCAVIVRFATLGSHVRVIVCGCPKKNVVWIAAFWIVAAMACEQPAWNFGVEMKAVCNTTSSQQLIALCANAGISRIVDVAGPLPAFSLTSDLNPCPEQSMVIENGPPVPYAITSVGAKKQPTLRIVRLCDGRRLATTALTKAGWIDSLDHVELSTEGLGRAAGCYKHRCGILIGDSLYRMEAV